MEKIEANEMAEKMFRVLFVGAIIFMLAVIFFVL